MIGAIRRFISKHRSDEVSGVPLDKLQLDAAKDRLEQRSQELQDESDKLSRMIRRMKRDGSKAGGR